MIDASEYPLPEITEKVLQTRKIGLGVMGWADMLLKLGIRYGSPESLELAKRVMKLVTNVAREHSEEMKYGNKTVTTIAPTGTISIIAGCSSGIEPNFDWVTKHKREDFEEAVVAHPLTASYLEYEDGEYKLTGAPDCFVTTLEVTPREHVAMQAAFQMYTDNAVSKTVNLPETATLGDIHGIYYTAWRMKCKGITTYRYGSRQDQVLNREKCEGDSSQSDRDTPVSWEEYTEQMGLPESRPYCLEGYIFKIPLEMADGKIENAYIVVGAPEGQPYEVFVNGNIREADPIAAEYIDTATRLVSLALRGGIPLEKVVEQLEKVPYRHMFSISHKIAQALKEFLSPDLYPPCPECGAERIYAEGCEKCSSCGWAHCG
jgi:ribonucleoside-diphosphate reductase alpha chain